jgi:hypothetical protein
VSHSENYQDTGHTTAFYQGVASERERIIKLIEETLLIHTDQKFFLIRSIKGEQK